MPGCMPELSLWSSHSGALALELSLWSSHSGPEQGFYRVLESLGMDPGAEFKAAMEEADAIGAR